MAALQRERIERVLGCRQPMLSPTAKRAVRSALLAVPMGFAAFGIADKAAIPDWLRVVISPGVLIGFRFVQQQVCRGLLDCLGQALGAYAKGAEIASIVNAVLYGFLIFGVATTVSAFSRDT